MISSDDFFCIKQALLPPLPARRGHEVVGEQPILRPGQTWEYRLACPLRTPVGSLEGYYEMWTLKEAGGRELPASMFPTKAVLGRFGLKAEAGGQAQAQGQQQ